MKNKILFLIIIACSLVACNDNKWLEEDPKNIITDEQTWNDPKLITSLLANYYDRLPHLHGVFYTGGMSEIDDAMWSGHRDQNWRNEIEYGNDYGRYWDYGLVRDINLALENIDKYSVSLAEQQKNRFKGELRFIRAFVYFEMVKRMGGVPIVTTQLIYSGDGDPSPLQVARSKEYEVYDFIFEELEAVKEDLKENSTSQTRANYYTALALESRAMLYAASTAKYNSLLASPIALQGEEVGIPATKATEYYKKSLEASKEIIASKKYNLYDKNPDKGENFYEMLNKKTDEVIFAKDFKSGIKTHHFSYENIVKSLTDDNESSSTLSPSLSLVESYDYLNGEKGTLKYKDATNNYITYSNISDIFGNKDARLYGTVVFPGTTFRGTAVNIQAGVAEWDGTKYVLTTGANLGDRYTDGGLWTGFDGPRDNAQDVSNTGFYLRKLVSDAPAASSRGTAADNWWPWFRLGEIYLNATEAAFELNDASALGYINKLREIHGGFSDNSLTTLSMEKIRNERRIELAFEDHRYFDLKRWRIAHLVWDGTETNTNAVVYGIYPYRIVRPGHADNGKFLYDKIRPVRFKKPRFFRMANYYSSIADDVLNNNPKLVKNPFH